MIKRKKALDQYQQNDGGDFLEITSYRISKWIDNSNFIKRIYNQECFLLYKKELENVIPQSLSDHSDLFYSNLNGNGCILDKEDFILVTRVEYDYEVINYKRKENLANLLKWLIDMEKFNDIIKILNKIKE